VITRALADLKSTQVDADESEQLAASP